MAATKGDDWIILDTANRAVNAGDGDDTVLAYETGATVDGGGGNDRILASLLATSGPGPDDDGDGQPDSRVNQFLWTDLSGGNGNDVIQASLRGVYDYALRAGEVLATLSGGAGNDLLSLDMVASLAWFTAQVDGGSGNDEIHVNQLTDETHYGAGGSMEVDAGSGNDRVFLKAEGIGDVVSMAPTILTVDLGDGDDLLKAYASLNEWMSDGAKNIIDGGAGNDRITATAGGGGDFGGGTNDVRGGAGNDVLRVTTTSDGSLSGTPMSLIRGDGGNDTIVARGEAIGTYTRAIQDARGGDGADSIDTRLTLAAETVDGTNKAYGGNGADRIVARLDVSAAAWQDTLNSSSATNFLDGGSGDDRLAATIRLGAKWGEGVSLYSELRGGAGDDRLSVTGGEGNILNGGAGDDTLLGSSGEDSLIGLGGSDELRGGGGEDVFVFDGIRGGERDRVIDFRIGVDVIDLSRIDANSDRAGDQGFRFGASEGPGRVWIENGGTNSLLHAEDGQRVLTVELQDGGRIGPEDYSAGDFIL